MRRIPLALCVLALFARPVRAAEDPSPTPTRPVGETTGTVLIADSSALSFSQSRKGDVKLLSDFNREDAETMMAINAKRGTWQSYLLYTTPEMKVPTSQPGFIITLGPPTRAELERRRIKRAEAEKEALADLPGPAPQPSTAR